MVQVTSMRRNHSKRFLCYIVGDYLHVTDRLRLHCVKVQTRALLVLRVHAIREEAVQNGLVLFPNGTRNCWT